ncbi:MAG: glycosyltransferase family 2 protein [Lentisphaerae bacterium]|jgi:GT2 family glycosyltransferase|nr:glycosyltransferase family 2 protein [Lentisphaerota bacterium]
MATDLKSSPSASVVVVIPHLNRLADTAECCRSLATQTLPPDLVVVVDNASTAHTAEELAAACPRAEVLRLERNLGFAGGVNAGIRKALSTREFDYIWVLNNDTFCPPETLRQLVAAAVANPRAGLTACPLLEKGKAIPPGKNLLMPWAVPRPAKADQTPNYLSGASLLIRRKLLDDIGLFDEGFFFFFEDADLSRRALDNGWQLVVVPDTCIEHYGSSTIRRMSELQARTYRAGHVRYLRKHTRWPRMRALPPFLFRAVANLLQLRLSALCGSYRGWRDGWRTSLLPSGTNPGMVKLNADETRSSNPARPS